MSKIEKNVCHEGRNAEMLNSALTLYNFVIISEYSRLFEICNSSVRTAEVLVDFLI